MKFWRPWVLKILMKKKDEMLENLEKDTQLGRHWLKKLSRMLLRWPKDRIELLEVLHEAKDSGLVDAQSAKMIEGVLKVTDLQVRHIMVPRSQMITVDVNASFHDLLPIIVDSGHSRFPVISENQDDVVGILLAKDLLKFCSDVQHKEFNMHNILRQAIYIPESKRVDTLLREFRLNYNHMAIVVDEYGSVSGLVTIEDVLEQIVGDIEDEYDIEDEPNIKSSSASIYMVKALTPIEEFNEFFQDDISDEERDTIGGYIVKELGYLPKRGEKIQLGRYRFKVIMADGRQIRLLQVKLIKK